MKDRHEILKIIDDRIKELQMKKEQNHKEWKEMDADGSDEYGLLSIGNRGDRIIARLDELTTLREKIEPIIPQPKSKMVTE